MSKPVEQMNLSELREYVQQQQAHVELMLRLDRLASASTARELNDLIPSVVPQPYQLLMKQLLGIAYLKGRVEQAERSPAPMVVQVAHASPPPGFNPGLRDEVPQPHRKCSICKGPVTITPSGVLCTTCGGGVPIVDLDGNDVPDPRPFFPHLKGPR